MDAHKPLLPIKVVLPHVEDYRRTQPGGGERKVFNEVTAPYRVALINQLNAVLTFFRKSFESLPNVPAVARVRLHPKALAKSHRPSALFEPSTCPIIAVEKFGTLLIQVSPDRLARLVRKIGKENSKGVVADLSTIMSIAPFVASSRLNSSDSDALKSIKLRVFEHYDARANAAVEEALHEIVSSLEIEAPVKVDYAPNVRVFRLRDISPSGLEKLEQFVGAQSLSKFPTYRIVRTNTRAVRSATIADFPAPVSGHEYPVVGLIDSGIKDNDPLLSPWVVARHSYVPLQEQDNTHGSFVAGMLIRARSLNHDDIRFEDFRVKIVDVVALDSAGSMTEDQLLAILDEVVPKHPEVRVWNLSLGTDELCRDDHFSELAMALDRLQKEYGVVFVIAAGNYNAPPFRGWPAEDLGEADRICAPADSVLGITVGSMAHLNRFGACVFPDEPSPFTRRGPGAAFLPKPELVGYGGNCDLKGEYGQLGVYSLNAEGNIVESVGTSFSTPSVSGLLANLDHSLLGEASPALLKALVIHSALLRNGAVKPESIRYHGFGLPGTLEDCVNCRPWMARSFAVWSG